MKHTDQVVYDAYHLKEDEFIEYYKLYWSEKAEIVKEQRELILSRIRSKQYEIVCYLDAELTEKKRDHILKKSCVNLLRSAIKAAGEDKQVDLNRCDTYEGILGKGKQSPKAIRLESEDRYSQVVALYKAGTVKSSEIARILGTNPSYVHRLINRYKKECYE